MFRTGLSLLLAMLLSFHAVSFATASVNIVSSVSRIDLKGGRIAGENADYYLDIPTMWSGYLIADREKFINSITPLEKLNFYYMPSDTKSKPALFLSMNIYGKFHYTPESGYRKLLETNKYIFSVYLPAENSLTNKTDKAIFDNMRNMASDDQYLSELIQLDKNDEKYFDNTIWVNGRQLNTKAVTDSNVTYLPVRDVCEHLGYSVGWLPEQHAVTLSRGDTYEILLKDDMTANHGFSLVIKNNSAFISSLYFISVLKINVEIDERMNVTLNES